MNSSIKFLRRVRIHGGECGAVARALHRKARISLPAVFENVSDTTNERKIMSKLTFKRLALVVVTTLGLGFLSSAPSSAAIVASSDTLTLSTATSAIAVGETATTTASTSFIGQTTGDSMVVIVQAQSFPEGGDGSLGVRVTDSSNAIIDTNCNALRAGGAFAAGTQRDCQQGTLRAATSETLAIFTGGGNAAISASYSVAFINPTVVGTYVFRIFNKNTSGSQAIAASGTLTWTVTVSANASSVGTTASKFWLNRATEFGATAAASLAGQNPGANAYKVVEADSALVVNAGTAGTYTAVGVITPVIMNSSDTKISTQTGARVQESMTITLSGAGALRSYGTEGVKAGLIGFGSNGGAYVKSITIAWNESAVVYSDGTPGVSTISGYIGASAISTRALTQGTKSITFVGRATTFDVTGFTAGQRAGGAVRYTGAVDSATSVADTRSPLGSSAGYVAALRFVAKDAALNAVTTAGLSTDKGEGVFYAISSDTSIVASGTVSATNTFATNTNRRNAALTCQYEAADAYWYCLGRVFDTGTVTLTIVDSRTITANGNSTTDTTHAVYKSAAFSVTFAGDANTGTIAFDKTAYNVNEKALLTITAKDGVGRTVADGTYASIFTSLSWKGGTPVFGNDASANAAGGRFTDLVTHLGAVSIVGGIDTAMVFMPTTAGTYTLVGKTGTETVTKDLLTITVTDPAQAATLAAAEAATDAAAEAIDAANAATDAANLAAEAADAATVAAEEARDAADAATAAVEELATQVATLMAALKAQITTLANTVAKIAKKVKA
jgi:hypothetical protein